MKEYLKVCEIIDWQEPTILEVAKKLASGDQNIEAISPKGMASLTAQSCFQWVRDRIYHSVDDRVIYWR